MEQQQFPESHSYQPSDTQNPHSQFAMPKVVLGILGGAIVLGLIGGAYYLGRTQATSVSPSVVQQSNTTISPQVTQTVDNQYNNWLSYTNNTYHYSFMYPRSWKIDTTKAEPTTTALHLLTSVSEVALTTPEGHHLRFDYNLSGVGATPDSFDKSENVTIDGRPFNKVYVNSCPISGGPQPLTPIPTTCHNFFSGIVYEAQKDGGPFFDINGKLAGLVFYLASDAALNDVSFKSVDTVLDQVINSFKFPLQ